MCDFLNGHAGSLPYRLDDDLKGSMDELMILITRMLLNYFVLFIEVTGTR